jgi:ubiquitin-conjugating enzyme E2 Z
LGIGREKPPGVVPYNADEDYQSNSADAPFEPFKDLCKRRFLWYYDSYLKAVAAESEKHKDGVRFDRMPFEGPGNIMEGTFQYTLLKKRLESIYEKLNEEMNAWAAEGQIATQKEMSIASNLQRQYEQIVEFYKNNDSVTLDLELVDKNPFVWQLVLFGRPMTNLDGGMFRIKLYLSTKFPDVLPRIKFETPIFHHRVSKDGILCYNPSRKDDLKSHIEAIIEAVEEESPAYDPRTLVNPEAANLFWGTPDQKKMYNRRLRRSVQESTE